MGRSRELAELGSAYDSGNSLGFRNRIINGDMRIDQRNAGASIANTGSPYSVDRWQAVGNQSAKYTVQQSSTAPTGFTNSLAVTSSSAYSVGASDFFYLRQQIEGYNVADFNLGTANAATFTLSFWVRSSLTGTFGGTFSNGASDSVYPFTYTISAANTWEYKTVTVAGRTSGTWNTGNGSGLYVLFALATGSNFTAAAGSWTSSTVLGATGQTQVLATNGATFYITGVQLEAGSVATPFERRDYGRELILCKRYYESMDWLQNSGSASNRPFYQWTLYYQVAKRAAPTMTTDGGTFDTSAGGVTATIDAITTNHFRTYPSNTQVWSSVSYTWYANAEL